MKDEIDELRKTFSEVVESSKENYFKTQGLKLLSSGTEAKTYWNILKRFISPYVTPVIPPLKINNIFVSDFQQKAEEFNTYFSNQCTPLKIQAFFRLSNF